jgi:hypothetical protein
MFAIAGGQERHDSHVDPDGRAGSGKRVRGHVIAGQDDVPAAAFPLDADHLHGAPDGPVLVNPYIADAKEVDAGHSRVRHRVPARAVFWAGQSTVSNQPRPLNRGYPVFSPALTRRKNAANALSSRRSVCCWEPADQACLQCGHLLRSWPQEELVGSPHRHRVSVGRCGSRPGAPATSPDYLMSILLPGTDISRQRRRVRGGADFLRCERQSILRAYLMAP